MSFDIQPMEYFEGDIANISVFVDGNSSLQRELSVNLTVEFGKSRAQFDVENIIFVPIMQICV